MILDSDPLAIHFHIPATDPLGRETIFGKLRFFPDRVELSWRLKGNVFRGGKGEMEVINLPYGEIEQVELVKRWFKIRTLVLRVSDASLVEAIPGVQMGKMSLEIDDQSRKEVKKLEPLIDYQKSVFILDAQDERLRNMRAED